jgi:hypothetical protein
MKAVFRPLTEFPSMNNNVAALTLRYRAAFKEYQSIVDKNAERSLTGGKPSDQALLEEEQAFEELDRARQALLDAAAEAYPTVH